MLGTNDIQEPQVLKYRLAESEAWYHVLVEKQIEAMMSKIENWINAGKRLLISISKTKTTTELSTARFE